MPYSRSLGNRNDRAIFWLMVRVCALIIRAMDDLETTPHDIEKRLRAAGSNLRQFCRRLGIWPSTFTRWKNGSPPSLALFRRAIALLDDIEREAERANGGAGRSVASKDAAE